MLSICVGQESGMTPMICLGVSHAVVVRGWPSLKAQVAEQLPGIPFSSGGLQALGRRLRVAVPWEPVSASPRRRPQRRWPAYTAAGTAGGRIPLHHAEVALLLTSWITSPTASLPPNVLVTASRAPSSWPNVRPHWRSTREMEICGGYSWKSDRSGRCEPKVP